MNTVEKQKSTVKKIVKWSAIVVFSLWVLFASAVTVSRILLVGEETHRERHEQLMDTTAILTTAPYHEFLAKPFPERIGTAFAGFIELTNSDKIRRKEPERPKRYIPPGGVIDEFAQLFDAWPPKLKAFANEHIAYVHTVEGLGSRGICWSFYDGMDFRFVFGLDKQVFTQTANENAKARDSVFFARFGVDDYEVIMEEPNHDTPARAVEYVLLHELGHAFGVEAGHCPNWNRIDFEPASYVHYPVFEGIFRIEYMNLVPNRYGRWKTGDYWEKRGETISADSLPAALRDFELSPFPSLYAAKNAYEFYADAFASYVHCVIQKKPWVLRYDGRDIKDKILQYPCADTKHFFDRLDLTAKPSL